MAPEEPVSVSIRAPSFISAEQAVPAVGTAGGILGGEFMGSLVTTASALTGNAAMAAGMITKGVMGYGLFQVSKRMTGGSKVGMWTASVGCMSSMVIDVIRRAWPGGAEAAGARTGLMLRRRPALRPLPPAVPAVAPPAPPTAKAVLPEVKGY